MLWQVNADYDEGAVNAKKPIQKKEQKIKPLDSVEKEL